MAHIDNVPDRNASNNFNFSFLHISDLHFHTESVDANSFREAIRKKINSLRIKPDFLIISGDIFHQGVLTSDDFQTTNEYISELPGSKFTYITPGNHDLDRSAQTTLVGSYNQHLTRRKIVLDKCEFLTTGTREFLLSDIEKEVLYCKAFNGFHAFIDDANCIPFASNRTPCASNYEVSIQYFNLYNSPYYVRIVLLNTALIAGQEIRGEKYRQKLDKLHHDATNSRNSIFSAECQLKTAKLQKQFEDHGALVIDEEKLEIGEKSCGRMSLSRKGLEILSDIQKYDPKKDDDITIVLTLFVGHHGYEYLSSETQTALSKAMIYCNSGIYLCGHAHRPKSTDIHLQNRATPTHITQLQAGAMFRDSTGYAKNGFNFGAFSLDINKLKTSGSIQSYFLSVLPSGDSDWFCEPTRPEDIEFHCMLNTPQDSVLPNPSADEPLTAYNPKGPAITGDIPLPGFDNNKR